MHFDDRYLHAELVDGRVILRPMSWYKASSLDERSEIEEISAQKPRFRVTPSRLLAFWSTWRLDGKGFFYEQRYINYFSVFCLTLAKRNSHARILKRTLK